MSQMKPVKIFGIELSGKYRFLHVGVALALMYINIRLVFDVKRNKANGMKLCTTTLSAKRTLIRTLRGKPLEAAWYTWNTLVIGPRRSMLLLYIVC